MQGHIKAEASLPPVNARACPGNSRLARPCSRPSDATWLSVSPVEASLGSTVRELRLLRLPSTPKLQVSG